MRRLALIRRLSTCVMLALVVVAVPVCGAAAPAGTVDTGSPADAAPSRAGTYAEFRRLFDAGNYEPAAAQAQRVVDLTGKEFGPASEELQVALMNLATTQYLAGDYVGAESTYLRVIELVESSGKPRLERLARANAGLATTYYAGKRYDLAVQQFERALSLTRRVEGLLSEHQLPLLEKYTDALTRLGRFPEALQAQKYALRVATRKYGDDDPRVAPALEKLGRWYARVGAYDPAHATLRRAIDIVESAQGPNSPQLVGPLTALADCDRRQLLDPPRPNLSAMDADGSGMFQDPLQAAPFSTAATAAEGQKALERAAAIASERADASPVQIADVRTQLGDWFQTRALPDRAMPQYQQAWQAANGVMLEPGKPLSAALFGKPVLLGYERPATWDRYASRPREQTELRTVLLDLTVTADGRARDAKVLDDSGDKRRADQTLQATATARYRPRFEQGRPAETPNVQFAQAWVVLLPKPAAAAPEVAAKQP